MINAEKVHVTGNKAEQSVLYYHTGYAGGIEGRSIRQRLDSAHPERVAGKGGGADTITRGPAAAGTDEAPVCLPRSHAQARGSSSRCRSTSPH